MTTENQQAMQLSESEAHIQGWRSPQQIKTRILAIQQLMTQVLKKDLDYGIIPGMPKGTKPSLWKPGSEQILAMFQIALEPVVEDLSTEDCYRYRVTARLTNALTQEFLGSGVGEASTDETKYKWKRTYSKKEFEETEPHRRRIKYTRYRDNDSGQYQDAEEWQVRQEPADYANTVLKIAKKRAQIDATLTVTGASSMFSQDLEDMSDEAREVMVKEARSKKASKKQDKVEDVVCAECRAVNGHLPSCKFRTGAAPAATSPQEAKSATQASSTPTQTQEKPTVPVNTERMMLKVNKGEDRSSGARKWTAFTVNGPEDMTLEWELFCWSSTLATEIKEKGIGKLAVFDVSKREKDGRTYYSIEHIVAIGETDYENDKPKTVVG